MAPRPVFAVIGGVITPLYYRATTPTTSTAPTSTTVTTTALATPQTYLSTGKLSSTLNLITPDKETGSLDLSVGASGGKGPPPAKKHKGLSPPVTTTGSLHRLWILVCTKRC